MALHRHNESSTEADSAHLIASHDSYTFHYVDEWADVPPTLRCNKNSPIHDLMYTHNGSHAQIATMLIQKKIRMCQRCVKMVKYDSVLR